MKELTIEGRQLSLEFTHHAHGLRLWANEYDGHSWHTISADLYPLMTEFEALASFASQELGDSVHAETLAQALGVEMRFSDDAKCLECGAWYHYTEMLQTLNGDYVCTDCEAVSMILESEAN